ncbi:MAG: 30S ribosomal protein S1 [Candidatus Omnitrophica bacterium]|nr:30S ribosomal protein S1 [Candidatus Omnitrophota bacterium]MCM8810505.1 30S ribosomal protein S1 [Candidatus Omnitrophota bacterium]MCM8833631.1 30S ribosomal protein S1 [Candidatus Omnitrophota bacterium]
MAEENVNKILEEKIESFKPGSLIKGKVIDVVKEEVIIDIGFKSEGVVLREEFKGRMNEIKKGEEVYVVIESLDPDTNGLIPLSKEKADIMLHWEQLEEKFKNNTPVEGVIFKRVKGGYRVDIGVTAFLPSSQTDILPIKNPNEYVGMKTFFKILKFDTLRKNIVVSRKEYIEEEKEKQKIEYLKSLAKNQLVKGVVKNIVDYGAFIEIEHGIIGLLHINDMSWGRISHPSQLLSIGEKIEVVVLDVNLDKQVVSFGLKQKTQNPWDKVEEKYPVGSIVEGKVVNITDYGVFIKLEEGVEGLLHISELSWTGRIKHPSEIVKTGDTLKVKVIDVKKDGKKISFSLRQLEPNPWPEIEKKYPVGSVISGKVYHITDFGAFIELEKGIDGLLHISNISDTPIKHPSEVLRKGQKVEVMVLEIDPENRKISLGLKQLGESFKNKKRREDASDNKEEL